MRFKIIWCIIFTYLALVTESKNGNYDGCKIYDVLAKNQIEKAFLKSLAGTDGFDFFSFPKLLSQPIRVMVHPLSQSQFENALNSYGIRYAVVIENVANDVNFVHQQQQEQSPMPPTYESVQQQFTVHTSSSGSQQPTASDEIFTRFLRFDEINAYLHELSRKYPQRVSVKFVGKSYEGRKLHAILITNGDGVANKKVIFVDAGIHAREWIAPATALYIINQLTENFAANSNLLKDYDWLILPVVNPDGYEYTHTTSRFWRKTRKPVTLDCIGTDGNRNFDFHWGDVGASKLPCRDDFMGNSPFSEPETRVVRDLMISLKGRGKMYLTLHSFGNYLLYPWGFTEALPSTWKDLDEVAQAGAKAIRSATGTKYTVGSSTNVLYEAAGGSDDYAFGKADFPISITMELPAGGSGFNPTTAQIKPFVEESWIGIEAMARKVIEKY